METRIKIRKPTVSDIIAISNLITETLRLSNSSDYNEDEIARLCDAHSINDISEMISAKEFFVAEINGHIVGCAALVFAGQEPGSALVTTVFVHPDFQGQGTGKSLMTFAEEVARSRNIIKLKLNSSITAHSFYIKLGYADISGYDSGLTGDDLFAMSKSIV